MKELTDREQFYFDRLIKNINFFVPNNVRDNLIDYLDLLVSELLLRGDTDV